MVGAGQDDLVPVGFFAELGKAQEYVLVVLAKNWSCLLEKDGVSNRYVIYVDPEDEDDIAREFSAYTEEQLDYGRRAGSPLELPVFQSGAWVAFIWVVLLLACYLLQGIYPSMVGGGLSSSLGMIDRGEWWRPFTALFLHADVSHLLGNIAMGSLFVILVSRSVGVAVGWLLVLAGGVVGNILTAWAHYPAAFHSLGASTAVFGALGTVSSPVTGSMSRSSSLRPHHGHRLSFLWEAGSRCSGGSGPVGRRPMSSGTCWVLPAGGCSG